MQKSPTSLCKKKHFRGVIGGRRCIGARAIYNAFTTWILVGLSRVMTCFTTLFEFHSEERFLQSPGTFWVCIFHVLAWVKSWSAAIKQIKIFVGYWILSSNSKTKLSRQTFSQKTNETHSGYCFEIDWPLDGPMASQHFENLSIYYQVWTQKETCCCVEIIKIPWLHSNLYL